MALCVCVRVFRGTTNRQITSLFFRCKNYEETHVHFPLSHRRSFQISARIEWEFDETSSIFLSLSLTLTIPNFRRCYCCCLVAVGKQWKWCFNKYSSKKSRNQNPTDTDTHLSLCVPVSFFSFDWNYVRKCGNFIICCDCSL